MSAQVIQNVEVCGIAAAAPKRVLEVFTSPAFSNAEAAKRFISSVGVQRVRRSKPYTCCSDMCQASAQKLMAELGWKPEDIDLLIYCSQSMDYILPATACVLHGKLGLSKNCACFDMQLGCSGWVYAVNVAANMMQGGSIKKALVLTGENEGIVGDEGRAEYEEKVIPLFGEAGTATAIQFRQGARPIETDTYTDGSGYEAIIRRGGGCRHPFRPSHLCYKKDQYGLTHRALDNEMDGAAVFVFGISEVPRAIKGILQRTGLSVDDVDYFIFHQANLMMNEQIRKKCKISPEKCPYSLRDFGNNSSASIPLTMVTQIREQLIGKQHRKIIACGFGVGLSWGVISCDTQSFVAPPSLKFNDLYTTYTYTL